MSNKRDRRIQTMIEIGILIIVASLVALIISAPSCGQTTEHIKAMIQPQSTPTTLIAKH